MQVFDLTFFEKVILIEVKNNIVIFNYGDKNNVFIPQLFLKKLKLCMNIYKINYIIQIIVRTFMML